MNSMFGKQVEPLSSSERIKRKRNLAIYTSLTSKTIKKTKNICLNADGNIKNALNYESYMNIVNGFYEHIKTKSKKNVKITTQTGAEKNINTLTQAEINQLTADEKIKYDNYISNSNCFNVYLNDDTDSFTINTFDDVKNSFIDFDNAEIGYNKEEYGIDEYKKWVPSFFQPQETASEGVKDVEQERNYFENPKNDNDESTIEPRGFVAYALEHRGEDGTVNAASSDILSSGTIERSSKIVYPYEKKGDCAKLVIPKLTFFDPKGNSGSKIFRDIKYFFPMSNITKYKDMCKN